MEMLEPIEQYLEFDFINDLRDKEFLKTFEFMSLEERELYYTILVDCNWNEKRSQKILEDAVEINVGFLLDFLEIKEGEEKDWWDVLYEKGIEKLEKLGWTVIQTCCDSYIYAYKLD
jgi:hypothetical protein